MHLPKSAEILAVLGLACSHCHKVKSSNDIPGLLRCGGCRRIAYCKAECQKADWRNHKAMCQAIQSVERDAEAARKMAAAYDPSTHNDIETLGRISSAHVDQMVALCEKLLKRPLSNCETNLLSYEPKCLTCARTDMILRTASSAGGILTPCERCNMSFGCCDEHWGVARALHQAPNDDLPGKVSQCDMNLQKPADVAYDTVLTKEQEKFFMWHAIKAQAVWTPLADRTWEDVIGIDVASGATGTAFERYVPACTRRISSLASTVFTVLYALEHLNPTTAWTEKSQLTINILIGSALDFFEGGFLYEAILHRAPKVKKVILYFFLPTAVPGSVSQAWKVDVCGDCGPKGRSIFSHFIMTKTFESFVHNEAELFVDPDLFIATSSSVIAAHDSALWRRTITLLVARRIPSVFTTFTKNTAESGQAVMRECGANLMPSLTGVRNPFGDMRMNPNPDKVYGFHSPNAWFVGGFR
ncbi:Zinc finger mynd domain-containing protein 17 [Mycena sanguinolenta]|uniref:Zinc finger mynd domain-containing protein 17 n=1 Tax=Mycena sanguinolenta TaxID=230812 RepID=A0A8H6XD09_9AGAR|nr:Zinc finger mynd domain-containing protein 17 [Mycena sanguinolenta]